MTQIIWEIGPMWDIGVGYRYVDRQLDTSDLFDHLRQNRFLPSVTHSF
jgi:hypothetical protein